VSDRLAREISGAFKPDQYSNPNGPLSHYESTGPEIWRDTEGKVTHFVAGVGTGGTISGVGKYLKEVSDGAVQIIGADPEGSVYSGGTGRPYLVEGVGEDFWPSAYDPAVVDRIIASSDAESFDLTLRLAREEGLLVGGSSGLAVSAALKLAADLGPDDVVVVLLPDGGRGYLGKVFNEKWMQSYGFSQVSDEKTVADLVRLKSGEIPDLVHLHPSDTVHDAIQIMTKHDVSQLPVLTAEPPVVIGEVIGAVDERSLVELVFSGAASMADSIEAYIGAPLPIIGARESVTKAREALGTTDALLVVEDGKPAAVLTRYDLLNYLSE
jgi:cystathionine beta-synthase